MTDKKSLSERDICTKYITSVAANLLFFIKGEPTKEVWKVDIGTIEANGYNLDIKNPHQPEEEKQYSSTELLNMLHQSFEKSDDSLAKLRKELQP